ncbi:hypothetical protein NDU88_008676 [Pleurodeles waltl]|uniref:Uncharacterized protein n=1 Tax=Pleurodeles waltl TaxID=8319 RepID=A0AAV7PV10_PLEWA|nr:hypothetical protein NDU88_008676 [Pleurodeles waltl]
MEGRFELYLESSVRRSAPLTEKGVKRVSTIEALAFKIRRAFYPGAVSQFSAPCTGIPHALSIQHRGQGNGAQSRKHRHAV